MLLVLTIRTLDIRAHVQDTLTVKSDVMDETSSLQTTDPTKHAFSLNYIVRTHNYYTPRFCHKGSLHGSLSRLIHSINCLVVRIYIAGSTLIKFPYNPMHAEASTRVPSGAAAKNY